MKCPKCQAPFASQVFKDHFQYEVCTKCEGRWIGGATLHDFCDLFGQSGEEQVFKHFMAQPLKTTQMSCPCCQQKRLTLVVSNGIEVEFCLLCNGVYFDAGEMIKAMPKGKYNLSKMQSSLSTQKGTGWLFDSIIGEILF